MTLQGKRILITGAAGGLGTTTMQLLRQQGARVVGIDKHRGESDPDSHLILADIRDLPAAKVTVAEAIKYLGGLDILINNAGILSLQDAGAAPGADVTEAFAVNLLGAWGITSVALPALLKSGGRVINVSSLFAVVNAPFIPAYCASKRAISAFSDVLRFQYGDRITVTTLYPGYMRTSIHDAAERQGLSVAKLVTFSIGQRKVVSFEEPLQAAARGVVRACAGRRIRDAGLTLPGTLTLMLARHTPSLVDWFVSWRLKRLIQGGMQVQLD